MVDTKALETLIAEKGIKRTWLVKMTGINRTSLHKKIQGVTEFKTSEVAKMCEVLEITSLKERDAIFFSQSAHE